MEYSFANYGGTKGLPVAASANKHSTSAGKCFSHNSSWAYNKYVLIFIYI